MVGATSVSLEKHPAGLYHNLGDLGYKRLFRADEVHNIWRA